VPLYESLNTPNISGYQGSMMPAEANGKSIVEESRRYRAMHPEIQYKLEPFIASTCDAIMSSGVMPSQQEMDDIIDDIYDEFCQMYPDMADYMQASYIENDMPEAVPTQMFGDNRRGYSRYSRRGLARDLISALLLARLFGRPYNPYYQYYPYY